MLAKVDGNPISPAALWWPAMNFDQFRCDGIVGHYELEIPRAMFVERLAVAYARCVKELIEDDRRFRAHETSPLRDAGYPPLDVVLDDAAARFQLLNVHMYEDVFEAFLPHPPSASARFMINSVDHVESSPESVVVRGRGYHAGPGFANAGGPTAIKQTRSWLKPINSARDAFRWLDDHMIEPAEAPETRHLIGYSYCAPMAGSCWKAFGRTGQPNGGRPARTSSRAR